ncbi:MAG: flagellar motor protein MotB [Gorillibacterium sp.]|nr:flagellar motor protein MotB [Gorillibacterium sp.]
MSRRSKKHKHEGHGSSERWLITYSDLITLLLVFFIVMYSMSKVDMEKYAQLSQSLQFSFNKSDSMIPQGGGGSGVIGEVSPKTDDKDKDKDKDNVGVGDKDKTDAMEQAEKAALLLKEQELQDLLQKITKYIDDNNLEATVSAVDTTRGIAVTLKDYFLFDLAKADLKSGAFPVLDKLGSLIPTLNAEISIEGHTDNLPLSSGAAYKDNWRLSSERSLSVLRYFTEQKNLSRDVFQSVAYADTMPIAANDSEANRQKNRRVEIVVLR